MFNFNVGIAKRFLKRHLADYMEIFHDETFPKMDWSIKPTELSHLLNGIQLPHGLNQLFNVWTKKGKQQWTYLYWSFDPLLDETLLERLKTIATQLYEENGIWVRFYLLLGLEPKEYRKLIRQHDEIQSSQDNLNFHFAKIREFSYRSNLTNVCKLLLKMLLGLSHSMEQSHQTFKVSKLQSQTTNTNVKQGNYMKVICNIEIDSVVGGRRIFNLGATIMGVTASFLVGGPVIGLIAVGGAVGAHHINKLEEMHHNGDFAQIKEMMKR